MPTLRHTSYLGDSIHLYAVWRHDPRPSFKMCERYGFLFPGVGTASRTEWETKRIFTGPQHGLHVRDSLADAFEVDRRLVGGSLFSRPLHEGYVALSPHASQPDKEWHPGLWKLVKDYLDKQGVPYRWLPMKGRTSSMELPEMVDVLSRAKAVVSVDSGPMHIADAFGIPVVGIFGPTSPVCYGAYQFRHLAVSHHPRPDNTVEWCKAGQHIMARIPAYEVIAQLKEALKL